MNQPAARAPLPRAFPLSRCQWQLAILWLTATFVLSLIMLAQIAGGVYGDKGDKALAWLLPNLLPVLGMIGGAIVYQVTHQGAELTVTELAYRGTWAFSVIYVLLLLSTLLLAPVARERLGREAIEWLGQPGALLTGLSAIVSAALGAFFVSSKPAEGA